MIKPYALAALGVLLSSLPCAASTYYVASNGSGTSCTLSAPCDSIPRALSAAIPGDSIVCISSPKDDLLVITKAITIDCASARARLWYSSNTPAGFINGVTIDIPTGDQLRTVRLRGLTIDGASWANSGGRLLERGIEIRSAAVVHVEDCVIATMKQQGIYDIRTGGQTKLFVKDTVISGNVGAGIVAASQPTSATVLDNVSLLSNSYGIATATGNNVVITRSTISGNSIAGVSADGGSQITLSNSTLSHNTVNVNAYGRVRLGENYIQFSNVAVQGGGAVSVGGNRFLGNGSIGTTPPLATGAPADVFN